MYILCARLSLVNKHNKVLPTRAQTFNSQHAATALRDPTTGSLLASQSDRIYWGGVSLVVSCVGVLGVHACVYADCARTISG
jgi:hypothetical protein